jgi:hypothetical protein
MDVHDRRRQYVPCNHWDIASGRRPLQRWHATESLRLRWRTRRPSQSAGRSVSFTSANARPPPLPPPPLSVGKSIHVAWAPPARASGALDVHCARERVSPNRSMHCQTEAGHRRACVKGPVMGAFRHAHANCMAVRLSTKGHTTQINRTPQITARLASDAAVAASGLPFGNGPSRGMSRRCSASVQAGCVETAHRTFAIRHHRPYAGRTHATRSRRSGTRSSSSGGSTPSAASRGGSFAVAVAVPRGGRSVDRIHSVGISFVVAVTVAGVVVIVETVAVTAVNIIVVIDGNDVDGFDSAATGG